MDAVLGRAVSSPGHREGVRRGQPTAGWEYPGPDPHGSCPATVPRVPAGAAPGKSPVWPRPGTCAGELLRRAPKITRDKTGGMKPSHTEKGF